VRLGELVAGSCDSGSHERCNDISDDIAEKWAGIPNCLRE